MSDSKKKMAGYAAAMLVTNGMTVGIGTGSTVYFIIQRLKERIAEEGLCFKAVPTSVPTRILCIEAGFDVGAIEDHSRLDIAFDGADRIDEALNAIKGGGAAQTREKVVAAMADDFVLVADDSKLVERLGGDVDVPVEVIPDSWRSVKRYLEEMGYLPRLRQAKCKDGVVVTDNGNYVLDIRLKDNESFESQNNKITLLPGVLEVGIFAGIASAAYIGTDNGVRVIHK